MDRVFLPGTCSISATPCLSTGECPGGETCDGVTQAGEMLLSWDPVVTTVSGDAVSLQHYVIYSSATPFTKQEVWNDAVGVETTTNSTSLQLPYPIEDRYYSVIAVDTRGNLSPF